VSKRPFVLFGLFAAICLIGLPIIALGKEGDSSAGTVEVAAQDEEGKELFANNCGYCHKLAAAGTDGVVGPDLDDILVTGGENSPEQYTGIYGRALRAVTCGVGGRMPEGILLGEEAKEVATFVGAYAGQIGDGPTLDTEDADQPEAPTDC
jgi:mono/diheme cytochrome c family protein